MILRGGTSKGAYFHAADIPAETTERNELLLRIMGSPDARQIDGLGGAHPLTSKVAVVSISKREDADIDYLFLQVSIDRAIVSDQQNCGNLLAGVGQFAVERGLISATGSSTSVRIYMVNSESIAVSTFPLSHGMPDYDGATSIDGVPGSAACVRLDFEDISGGTCGALLPTGNFVDVIAGIEVTLIDNGMPVVILRASDVGVSGYETPSELESNTELVNQLEVIRLLAGPLMGLGDVTDATVPKMTLVAPPIGIGHICTRTFIPHRCHEAIGVLGAVTVATAALLPGTPAAAVAKFDDGSKYVICEHPTGTFDVVVDATVGPDGAVEVRSAGIVRTARKLMDGHVFPRPIK